MQYLTIGGNTYSIPTSGGSTVTIERALTSGTKSATINVDGTSYDLYAPTPNAGTVTSVRVQATSPVQSSTSTAQSSTLNTTISLADGYGDTKNPYASKTKNYVLAAPATENGVPSFRALVAADIPDLSGTYLTSHLTGSGAISVENGQIKLIAKTAMTGGTEEYISSITNHTIEGISGFLVFCDNGSGDGMMKFFPDMEGVSTASQQIINSIPTKVSQLTNDRGFITGYTETDPTVPSWAKEPTKPTYTASEVGALSGNVGGVFFGTCSTAAGTVAKVVKCADFTADNLKAGTIIVVSFAATNGGAVASLTMDVNGTGAKPIKYINNGTLGNLSSAGYIKANTEYPFYYDGANWVCWFNVNTTYSAMSESEMHTGTATTGRLITAQRLYQAVKYHAPVTSVNGSTGDVTVTVPTNVSELTNDMGFIDVAALNENLATPTFCATDATSQAVLQQAFGVTAEIVVPSSFTSIATLLFKLEPRKWFCWMNGTEMEFARLSVSVNTGTSAITLYLRGRTSIATGRMSLVDRTGDSSWTVTPMASSAVELVRW